MINKSLIEEFMAAMWCVVAMFAYYMGFKIFSIGPMVLSVFAIYQSCKNANTQMIQDKEQADAETTVKSDERYDVRQMSLQSIIRSAMVSAIKAKDEATFQILAEKFPDRWAELNEQIKEAERGQSE